MYQFANTLKGRVALVTGASRVSARGLPSAWGKPALQFT